MANLAVLLTAANAGDAVARKVAADVLEEQGHGERAQALRSGGLASFLAWDNRRKVFAPREEGIASLEAWRHTPGRIHFVEATRAQHDTSGLDYDRPVRTTINSSKIGTPLEQGVVADKRVVQGQTEYLLRPHTKTTRRQWEDAVCRKRIGEIERMLKPSHDDYRERDDAPQLLEELARLKVQLLHQV